MTTPTLDYEMAFNGWNFCGTGSGVQLLKADGLEGLPDLRNQDDPRGYNDGMFTGQDFLSGRTITLKLQVLGDGNASVHDRIEELKANLVPQRTGTGVLQFLLPGREVRRINARVRRRALPVDVPYSLGLAEVTVELFAPDPRVYTDSLAEVVLDPGTEELVGRLYPRTYPMVYTDVLGGMAASGDCVNAGNWEVLPTVTIAGEVVNPVLLNLTTGTEMAFNLTMAAGDELVVDSQDRTVRLNGTSVRNTLATWSTWLTLPPGTTTVAFMADDVSSATATIAYRNGYL